MRIRTRALLLLLALYGMTCQGMWAASPAAESVVFTPEETARLDSLRGLMLHYQETGDYEAAYRTGLAYNHLRLLLQERSLNHEQQHHLTLSLTVIFTIMTLSALLLIYLHAHHNDMCKLQAEKRRAEDMLMQARMDNSLQTRFLRRLDHGIRRPADDIVHHSLRIYGRWDASSVPEERAESRRIVHERTRQLLRTIDELVEECTGTKSKRYMGVLLLLLTLASTQPAGAWMPYDMHHSFNRAEYCYKEDGIAAYEPQTYSVDLLREEEMVRYYRRRTLEVVTLLLLAFTAYLALRVWTQRRNARLWKKQKVEVEEAARLALEARARRRRFLEQLSHELRTPLNAIQGFADVLCDEELAAHLSPEEQAECGERGRHGTRDLRKLVDGSLELCQILECAQEVHPAACDVRALLAAIAWKFHDHLKPGVRMVLEPSDYLKKDAEGKGPVLVTDCKLLRRALELQLDNACKFTREGHILLACRRSPEGRVEFVVEDTGCGIPAEKAELVFHHFEKLDKFVPGIGLGLSLCRATMHLIGGEVSLDTEYKEGARFVITL